jgi:hypothetical protein
MPLVELTPEQAEIIKYIRQRGTGKSTITKTCRYKLLKPGKTRSDYTRNGQFRFYSEQHKKLCDQNGKYRFIVYDGWTPVKQMECLASDIDLSLFSYYKNDSWSYRDVSWANIESMLEA